MKISSVSFATVASFAVFCFTPATQAQTLIITDTFSGTNGATLNGRTPDGTNLPGRTFSSASYLSGLGADQTIDTSAGSSAPSALAGFNGSVTYNLSSNGGYTKPALLTLSLDLQINTSENSPTPASLRGVGLGFYSAPRVNNSEVEAFVNFTGLVVSPAGTLDLVIGGTLTSAEVAAFSGFSTSNFYTLTYSLDTVTGSITSVYFNGNDYSSTFTGSTTAGVFTATLIDLFGYYGSTATSLVFTSRVDNLSISTTAIPEPSSYAALAGVAMLGFVAWRRKCGLAVSAGANSAHSCSNPST